MPPKILSSPVKKKSVLFGVPPKKTPLVPNHRRVSEAKKLAGASLDGG
jgi:hypothetical protein